MGGYTYICIEAILQQVINFWNALDNIEVLAGFSLLDCIFAGFLVSCCCAVLTCFSDSEGDE